MTEEDDDERFVLKRSKRKPRDKESKRYPAWKNLTLGVPTPTTEEQTVERQRRVVDQATVTYSNQLGYIERRAFADARIHRNKMLHVDGRLTADQIDRGIGRTTQAMLVAIACQAIYPKPGGIIVFAGSRREAERIANETHDVIRKLDARIGDVDDGVRRLALSLPDAIKLMNVVAIATVGRNPFTRLEDHTYDDGTRRRADFYATSDFGGGS